MKDQILKIAKVKSEKEFYKKYPTEEAFMAKHGKALEKAAMGKAMVNKQLKQLTDFGNPPVAQYGISFKPLSFDDALTNSRAMNTGLTKDKYVSERALGNVQDEPAPKESDGISNFLSLGADIAGQFMGGGNDASEEDKASSIEDMPIHKDGGYVMVPKAQFGAIAQALKGIGQKSGGIGNMFGDMIGGKGTAKGITDAMGPNGLLGKGGPGLKSLGSKAGLSAAGKAAGLGVLNAAPEILNGIGQMKEQKNQIGKAQMSADVSGLVSQATRSNPVEMQKHNFARPEDALVQPDQLGPSQGVGTNYLQMQSGGEIQNTYAPGNLYDDLGYEPLSDSEMKQYRNGGDIPEAAFGDYFQSSGQASIGKGVGSAIGNVFGGPLGGMVGGALGTVAGNLLGGARDANKLAGLQGQTQRNTMETAGAQMSSGIRGNFGSFMEDGGYMNPNYNPQVITKFGEYNTKDLLKPDPMMDTLRSGGHLAQVDYTPPSAEAMFTGRRDLPYQMEDGGYMAMGGNLQTHWGGDAELMSYNPYIPGGGETVMFRGQSHDDTNGKGQSGIGITYGDSPVEVERGEPMTEMNNGGVVFGNMVIDKSAAKEINDPKAKGKKYKNYVADLSKTEAKQNKIMDKASKLALDADENDPFGRLSLNSSQASLIGANMKLKDIADKKQNAAAVQNAILDTAEEYGLVSDDLAKGKIKEAKFGGKFTAQDGTNLKSFLKTPLAERKKLAKDLGYADYSGKDVKQQEKLYDLFKSKKTSAPSRMSNYNESLPIGENIVANALGSNYNPYANEQFSPINYPAISSQAAPTFAPIGGPSVPTFANLTDDRGPNYNWATTPEDFATESAKSTKGKGKGKGNDWRDIAEQVMYGIMPLLRPTDQEPLDPSQLYPEMLALANNQLEAVQAQKFQPLLQGAPSDISFQDQLNEITAQSRIAERMMQNNPEAAATLFAQVAQAKAKVLADQFRANQERREQVYAGNRNMLNQSQLQNLEIFDQQYQRQAQAKSNTKAQALEAMKSIADKTAKNKLENRQLGIMENMYNYRFGPQGRAFSYNDLYQFNMDGAGSSKNSTGAGAIDVGGRKLLPIDYDDAGNPTKYKTVGSKKEGGKIKALNGSIVKAVKLKNI